jgi:voltage-gated potassium channel
LKVKEKRLYFLAASFVLTFFIGIIGYHHLEDLNYFDSFYMTLITISTVGFTELKKFSTEGRILTSFIIICGWTSGAYTIGTLLKLLIEGELTKNYGRKKLLRQISHLKNHYIICGFGRIGSLIAQDLADNSHSVVVIENDPQLDENNEDTRLFFLKGDATLEESLEQASIHTAKALITAVKSDSDNVFITLTARSINPSIYILSRASDSKTEQKLKRAGASKVILPYIIGGKRMSQELLRPNVANFIDITSVDSSLGLRLEEFQITDTSNLAGKNLIESNLRKNYGIIIVAIKKSDGQMIFNPAPSEMLVPRDVLVVLGKTQDINNAKNII